MSTVQVACKLPAGFLMEIIEPALNEKGELDLRPAPRDPDKPCIFIKGTNASPLQRVGPNPLANTYVVTEVEEGFARAWFKRNATLPFVKNEQVFIVEKAGAIKAHAGVETGFEPLHPVSDPRLKREAPKAVADLESMAQSGVKKSIDKATSEAA